MSSRQLTVISVLGILCTLFAGGCLGPLYGIYEVTKDKTEDPAKPQSAPIVIFNTASRLPSTPEFVDYTLFDNENNDCSIIVEYSANAVDWYPAPEDTGSGNGTTGLTALSGGSAHQFAWDFDVTSDPGLTAPESLNISIRITATDSAGLTGSAVSGGHSLGNAQPVIEDVRLPVGQSSGTVTIEYDISDTHGDMADIQVEFMPNAGGWTSADPDSPLALNNIPTAVSPGTSNLFPWDSDGAGNMEGTDNMVSIRIRGSDNGGTDWGPWFTTAEILDINNNSIPQIFIGSVTPNQNGIAFIPYTCTDAENSNISVLAEYKKFGETAWKRATDADGTTPLYGAAPFSGSFAWDTLYDGISNADVAIRLVPSESNTLGTGAQASVHIENSTSDSWTALAGLPAGLEGPGAVEYAGRMYVFGGRIGSSSYSAGAAYYDPATDTWTALPDMPGGGRTYMGCVQVNGIIYLIGGHNDSGRTALVETFDPETEMWSAGTAMTSARSMFACGVIRGKIYLAGGYQDSSPNYLNVVQEYDPGTDTWTGKAALPASLAMPASAVALGKLYVIGGFGGTDKNTTYEYDPDTNAWAAKATLPVAGFYLAGSRSGDRIFVIGGRNNSGATGGFTNVQIFDILGNSWSAGTPLSQKRCGIGSAAIGGKIYCAGGYYNEGASVYSDIFEAYTPGQGAIAWSGRGPLPFKKREPGGAALDGKIYSCGGSEAGYYANVHEYDPGTDTWGSAASMPAGRSRIACVTLGRKLYALGGYTTGAYYNNNWCYDPDTNTWDSSLTPIPTARASAGAAAVNGRIYVIAGEVASDTGTTVVEEYDPGTDGWSTKTPIPSQRSSMGCVAVKGQIYVFGGKVSNSTGSDDVYRYDPGTDTWSILTSMPVDKTYFAAEAVGNRVFIMGGYNFGTFYSSVHSYDVMGDAWRTETGMSMDRMGPGSAVIGETVYVMAGYVTGLSTSTPTMEAFTKTQGSFLRNIQEPPPAVAEAGSFIVDGTMYIAGGRDGALAATAAVRKFNFRQDISDGMPFATEVPWADAAAMPTARRACGADAYGNEGYVAGGFDAAGNPVSALEVYTLGTDSWTPLAPMITARAGLALIQSGDFLYAIGGENAGGAKVGTVEAYDLISPGWTTLTPMSTARSHFAAVMDPDSGFIYVFGGDDGAAALDSIEIYNPTADVWAVAGSVLPYALKGSLALVSGNTIRIFGGETTTGQFSSQIFKFYPASGAVLPDTTELPVSARGLFGYAASAGWTHRATPQMDGFILLGGGFDGASYRNEFLRFYAR